MRAAVWLPRFQLQAALRDLLAHPGDALAVLDEAAVNLKDKGLVLHANETAERSGVRPGMTATQAQARCPRIEFLRRNEASEISSQRALLDEAAQWSPFYEDTAPGLCTIDLEHLRDIAGREELCGQGLHEQLIEQKLDARVGIAHNPDLAALAAQAALPVLVLRHEQDTKAFLHGLPVAALHPSPAVHEILQLWGVSTLGMLVKLPRSEVAARLGREGLMLRDMAAGGRERLLKLVRPPVSYREEHDLDHEIENLEPLAFHLERFLQRLCTRLAQSWMVAEAMLLTMQFTDKTAHCRELKVAEPTRDAELLMRVLRTHLEGMQAPAPIIHVALEIKPARPAGSQSSLFGRELSDPNRFAETLTRLEALLGTGRAGKARLQPSRRTDAFTVANFTTSQAQSLAGPPLQPPGLPLRRLRPAAMVQVQLVGGRPTEFVHGKQRHEVHEAEGPWLLSGDWWDVNRTWSKEVWTVRTREGALFQLARQNDAWVLEGLLG